MNMGISGNLEKKWKSHKFGIKDKLEKKLVKLKKRDKLIYNIVMNKIDEILICDDIHHYKNLRSPLQKFKRVHIKSSFVLTFKYIESEDKVIFYDFDHHDKIYKNHS